MSRRREEVRPCHGQAAYLQEGEDEAHGEVGQPVEGPSHDVGGRPVGLLEELCCDQEGNPRWKTRTAQQSILQRGEALQSTAAAAQTDRQTCTYVHVRK